MSAECQNFSAGLGVPDLHRLIVRSGCQPPTIGTESHVPDEIGVPLKVVDRAARLDIPNLQHRASRLAAENATGPSGSYPFAIRAEATGVEIISRIEISVI